MAKVEFPCKSAKSLEIAEIGVKDLMYAGLFIDSRTFRSFEVFFTITVIYILMALLFKALLQILHRTIFKWKAAR